MSRLLEHLFTYSISLVCSLETHIGSNALNFLLLSISVGDSNLLDLCVALKTNMAILKSYPDARHFFMDIFVVYTITQMNPFDCA